MNEETNDRARQERLQVLCSVYSFLPTSISKHVHRRRKTEAYDKVKSTRVRELLVSIEMPDNKKMKKKRKARRKENILVQIDGTRQCIGRT